MREELFVRVVGKEKIRVVFVYCGVGIIWENMCKEFFVYDVIFRKSIRDIDVYLFFLVNIFV